MGEGERMTNPARRLCPHCGAEIRAQNYQQHLQFCLCNPEARNAIIAIAEDSRKPGYAVKFTVYRERARNGAAPGGKALRRSTGMSWGEIVRAVGLKLSYSDELDAPLTDAERHACTRRGAMLQAETGGLHGSLKPTAYIDERGRR